MNLLFVIFYKEDIFSNFITMFLYKLGDINENIAIILFFILSLHYPNKYCILLVRMLIFTQIPSKFKFC